MSSFGLGETFAPAKSSGSASALFSGGGAPARAAKAAPAKAASKKGYDDAVDRVLAKGKKRRRPDDDGFVTATAELAARVNAAPKKAKAPAPAKPAAAAPKPKAPKPAAAAAPAREDEDRTVFVGNVPTEATKKQLRTFFKTFGAVATVRTRSLPTAGVKVDDAGNDALVKRVCAQKHLLSDAKRTMHAYVVFETAAAAAEAARADLFERHRTSGACDARKRDVIFSVYNYPDASTLYLFLRSLREAGGVADAVVFTHRAHRALRAVGDRYGAKVLEYFAPLTGHPTVAAIMARPHMQALKVDFPGPLIKNYKFTFMYCYLLEFGDLYGRAAFMDVRDLYFQRDPFAYAACLGLTAATETAALDVDDRKAIHADHYPKHCATRWEDFRHLPPINSGAFIADVAAMLRIVNASSAVVDRCGAGYDQGTFTELVYLGRLPGTPVALSTTETGAIGMICNSLDVAYDTYREVANDAGDAYAIVHQFDRFAELTDDLSTRMPLDHAKLLAPKATMLEPQTCGGEG